MKEETRIGKVVLLMVNDKTFRLLNNGADNVHQEKLNKTRVTRENTKISPNEFYNKILPSCNNCWPRFCHP